MQRMRRILILSAALFALHSQAKAADSTVPAMTAASALGGTELQYCVQGAADRKCTAAQMAAYVYGLMSGDATANGTGTLTLKNTGPGATGPIGSTTVIPVVTIDAQGRVTALTSATAAGTVSSISAGCGTATGGSPITTSGTISAALTLRSNTAATDTIVSTDCGNAVYENRATSVAVAIAQAGTAGFASGAYFLVCNINAGVATITPTTSTIGGASTLAIPAGTAAAPVCYGFQSDGTNYNLVDGPTVNASLLTAGTIPSARLGFGTSVFTAAANTLSSAGGLTSTIASGTSALGTSAIGSAACATVVTTSATNTATTDVVLASFNGDPTGVTGYVPLTSGMLTIIAYPSANNANFKVCNNTNASITPGAITLNWRVVR